jgi:DNA-directed RNA polymerase specialized sigma24 family protein
MKYKRAWKKSPSKFTHNKRCGYSVDFQWLDQVTLEPSDLRRFTRAEFLGTLFRKVYEKSKEQGNPLSKLIEKEEEEAKEKFDKEFKDWLPKAMAKLPKNQEACLYFRFRFDNKELSSNLRSTNEIAKILGVCQATVYRHIQRGLTRLKKDFNTTFEYYINRNKI